MEKGIVIVSEWIDKKTMRDIESIVERKVLGFSRIDYVFYTHDKKHSFEDCPQKNIYLTSKDFSLFGKLRNTMLKQILQEKDVNYLIINVEGSGSILKKIIKNSRLISVGINLSDLSFNNLAIAIEAGTTEEFFEKTNNYLHKIKN
ncbi:hypothetical protein CW751_11350 [Brumimicrobium salinarum]|uniref:Uncharacterized protein n=1 Tax=Brumimicrobium salinarum TaxID=2058658 RepID=A0A2I0R0J2_9FLAO|nr:hypothetical protein [Brumimicrobium salinarum]PKR80094.1 hypothetical protein CW751_11350 [Brumimicrobium salinarum]